MPSSFGSDQHAAPLVGRERERSVLRERLAAVAGGEGSLVLIGGEAGIGKSTLVEALAREAMAASCLVLTGHCYDLTATPPYGPWQGLVAGSNGPLAPLASAFAAMAGASGVTGQADLFARVRANFTSLAAERPVIVVLEDLHWADPGSLDLLRVLTRRPGAVPLLVMVTYRIDELTRRHPLYQLLPILVREAGAERIELKRLADDDVRLLVAGRYHLADAATARLVAHLQQHAEGNPLYTRELLRAIEEEGVLQRSNAGWSLGDLSRIRVPALVQQVIEGRLARLGEAAREALALAAVIGQEVSLDLWSAVGGVPEEKLLTTVELAVEAHLLTASAKGVGFAHALVRETLYEGMLPPRRRLWHRKVAEALITSPAADPDAVADHFGRAGDERAWEWLVRAGERAQRAYAWRTAAERFAAAVALIEGRAEQGRERGWFLYRIGRLVRMADPVKSVAYLAEAERVAVAVGDPVLTAYARFDHGMLLCFVGEFARGIAAMEVGDAALAALPATVHAEARADLAVWIADALPRSRDETERRTRLGSGADLHPRRGSLVMWLAFAGRFAEARAIGEPYLRQVEAGQPDEIVLGSASDARAGLGIVESAAGHPDAARALLERARTDFRFLDHHVLSAMTTEQLLADVVLPYQTTRTGERRRLLTEVDEAYGRAHGALLLGREATPYFFCLEALMLDGAWVAARSSARQLVAEGAVSDRALAMPCLAWLARWQGDADAAWTVIGAEFPHGPATEPGDREFRAALPLIAVAASLTIDADEPERARPWIEAHDRWLAWSGAVRWQVEGLLLWARFHRATGDAIRARRDAEAALTRATEPEQPLAQLAAHRLLGELAVDARRWDDADRQLGASLALAEACAAPFERALTLLAFAELRAATGARVEASVLLDEVRAICAPLEARPALARTDALAARLAAPAPARRPAGLSEREVEVLRLAARGLTRAEMGDALSISEATVGRHLTNIYAKLDVSGLAGATRFAVEHGLT